MSSQLTSQLFFVSLWYPCRLEHHWENAVRLNISPVNVFTVSWMLHRLIQTSPWLWQRTLPRPSSFSVSSLNSWCVRSATMCVGNQHYDKKNNQNETPPFFSAVVHSRRCQSGDRSFNGRPEEERGCGELPLPFASGCHQGRSRAAAQVLE